MLSYERVKFRGRLPKTEIVFEYWWRLIMLIVWEPKTNCTSNEIIREEFSWKGQFYFFAVNYCLKGVRLKLFHYNMTIMFVDLLFYKERDNEMMISPKNNYEIIIWKINSIVSIPCYGQICLWRGQWHKMVITII